MWVDEKSLVFLKYTYDNGNLRKIKRRDKGQDLCKKEDGMLRNTKLTANSGYLQHPGEKPQSAQKTLLLSTFLLRCYFIDPQHPCGRGEGGEKRLKIANFIQCMKSLKMIKSLKKIVIKKVSGA